MKKGLSIFLNFLLIALIGLDYQADSILWRVADLVIIGLCVYDIYRGAKQWES